MDYNYYSITCNGTRVIVTEEIKSGASIPDPKPMIFVGSDICGFYYAHLTEPKEESIAKINKAIAIELENLACMLITQRDEIKRRLEAHLNSTIAFPLEAH